MQEDTARLFVQALGCKQIERKGKWLTATCPLAPFLHTGGKDNHPSFGVKIGDESPFNCFACESGGLHKLVTVLDFHLSKLPHMRPLYDLVSARLILEGAELDFLPLPPFESQFAPDQVFQEWPQYVLDMFGQLKNAPQAVKYLNDREGGISQARGEAAGLLYDHQRKMIVCPYHNVYGKLAGARGRSIDPDCPKAYRHYDYTWKGVNNAPLVWYGEEVLNMDGPVIVVEGQFDCLHVRKAYPKVIANLTAKPSHAKLKKLSQCDQVILMMDNDETGYNARLKYQEYLVAQGVQTGIMVYPEQYHDPAQVPLEWFLENLLD